MDSNDYFYIDLNTISQLEEYDKLGLKNINNDVKLVVDKYGYTSSITRRYNGYNRISIIDYLKNFTNKLEKYVELLVKGSLHDYGEKLMPVMISGIKGLENLKLTYKDDSNIISELSLIIIKFNEFINELKNINVMLDCISRETNDR